VRRRNNRFRGGKERRRLATRRILERWSAGRDWLGAKPFSSWRQYDRNYLRSRYPHGKRLQLLKELLPNFGNTAVLAAEGDANVTFAMQSLDKAATELGVTSGDLG